MKNTADNPPHDTAWYERRIDYLAGFMLPERIENFDRVLALRTRYLTLCAENIYHSQNASALVRSCEAFGIQEMHAVEERCAFRPNVNIVRGTDKWIDLRKYRSTKEMLDRLRARGYRIVATSPHAGDRTPETLDLAAGPLALIFGTEHAGISDEAIAAADDFVRIPMQGFVESLNVSASAAILLYTLTRRLRESPIAWQLSEPERTRLRYEWITRSVRDSAGLLTRFEASLSSERP